MAHTHSASVKAAALTGIALLLLIPLALLGSLVTERTAQRDAAVQSVARGWGDRQWVGGPLLAIPVTIEANPARTCDWYVLPERLEISVELQVQDVHRRLGLYDVPVYIARIHAKGEFDLPHEITRLTRGETSLHLHLEQARFLLPIQDPRGLRDLTSRTQESLNFEPSSGFPIPVLAAPLGRPSPWMGTSSIPTGFSSSTSVASWATCLPRDDSAPNSSRWTTCPAPHKTQVSMSGLCSQRI